MTLEQFEKALDNEERDLILDMGFSEELDVSDLEDSDEDEDD